MTTKTTKVHQFLDRYIVNPAAYLARLAKKGIKPKGFFKQALNGLTTALATPATLTPTNATHITFVWAAVTGATGYQLQSSTSSTFASAVTTLYTGANTSFTSTIPAVTTGNTLYFRVKATSYEAGDSAWKTANITV